MMRAGNLDRRVTIQMKGEVGRDPFNNPIDGWTDIGPIWAAVEHIRDRERWAAQEVGAEATVRFRVRWSSQVAGVSPQDRVVYDGRTYDIAARKEIGRREGIELTATARVD